MTYHSTIDLGEIIHAALREDEALGLEETKLGLPLKHNEDLLFSNDPLSFVEAMAAQEDGALDGIDDDVLFIGSGVLELEVGTPKYVACEGLDGNDHERDIAWDGHHLVLCGGPLERAHALRTSRMSARPYLHNEETFATPEYVDGGMCFSFLTGYVHDPEVRRPIAQGSIEATIGYSAQQDPQEIDDLPVDTYDLDIALLGLAGNRDVPEKDARISLQSAVVTVISEILGRIEMAAQLHGRHYELDIYLSCDHLDTDRSQAMIANIMEGLTWLRMTLAKSRVSEGIGQISIGDIYLDACGEDHDWDEDDIEA